MITEVFNSQSAYDAHQREVTEYKGQFDETMLELIKTGVTHIRGGFGPFCPELQFITLDALEPKDWPHNISDNSVFLMFEIDHKAKTFEVARYGHIYLTKHDMDVSHLCMASMKQIHTHLGKKWPRKSKFKDLKDLANKMAKAYREVMVSVVLSTDGYPYKQLTIDIY